MPFLEFLGQFTIRCIYYFSKRCWHFWDRAQNMLILELFGVGGAVYPKMTLHLSKLMRTMSFKFYNWKRIKNYYCFIISECFHLYLRKPTAAESPIWCASDTILFIFLIHSIFFPNTVFWYIHHIYYITHPVYAI